MIATYRLQLTPAFTFADAEKLLPYFQRLGVSHLYLSPITKARSGSTHGYDVIDHNAVNPELGGREGFDRLLQKAREAGLQLIIDFVPNHAGVGPRNQYWQDVLAYGPHSPFARYFDIDWDPLKPELQGKILLPFLGSPYGEAFDNGEIGLKYEDGRFYAMYFDNRYALNPASYATILEAALPLHERSETYWSVKDLHEAYSELDRDEREKSETLRRRLQMMAGRIHPETLCEHIRGPVLHKLLEQQFWRLSYWKTAGYEINYRRFFDINGLVGLRMEDAEVFWDAHSLLGELLAEEGVAGVRIDHVDGLFNPHEYLEGLRALGAQHIWVEKILALGETLPQEWPVHGTTGYEFMNDVMGILLQPAGELPLDRVYRRFVPEATSFDEVVHRSKNLVMSTTLSSELFRLAYELDRISEADYHTRDFTLEALREALSEVVAAFDRYRTYLPYDAEDAHEVIHEAVHLAQQRNPAMEPSVYQFIARCILGEVREDLRDRQRAWTGRFQQYTAPVAAKGVEDTAFYRYLRLVALNEVGGEPDHFGQTPHAFHAHARFRAHRYPLNLLATATHDHKRGEDTRMRLIALAELPNEWEEVVHELGHLAESYRKEGVPSRADEYLFYQILVALWHDADREELPDRLWEYMLKASRESKVRTSWINQEAHYEGALEGFIRGVLADERTAEIVSPLAARLAELGFFNTLSQVVIKFTTAGVPDIYQGSELLDLSLVDPDNRRPVDYDLRASLIEALQALQDAPDAEAVAAMTQARDARAKLFFILQLLRLRRELPDAFMGGYRAIDVEEPEAAHWLAFAREGEEDAVLVIVPRFPATWPEHRQVSIALPEDLTRHAWTDVFTGASFEPMETLDTGALALPWGVLRSRR